MVTVYDVNEVFYARFVAATAGDEPAISIGGAVYNKDRNTSAIGEDITIITTEVSGDEFPLNALVNINAYAADLVEQGNGYVRDGKRLSTLTKSISNFLDSLLFDSMELVVENIAELDEQSIHQHYVNFRVRLYIYGNIN